MASLSRSKRPLLAGRARRLAQSLETQRERILSQPISIPSELEFQAHGEWDRMGEEAAARARPAPGPAPHGDLGAPWWAFVGGIELVGEKRQGLMAIAPEGAQAPRWPQVLARAQALFEQAAIGLGRETIAQANQHAGAPRDVFVLQETHSGRRAWIRLRTPLSWIFAGSETSAAIIKSRDPRRARRHRRRPCPSALAQAFGQAAPQLWLQGASMRALAALPPLFDPVSAALDALAQALRDEGALGAWVLQGPLELPQRAMASPQAFEPFEADVLDPLRSRWALESAAGPGASKPRLAL